MRRPTVLVVLTALVTAGCAGAQGAAGDSTDPTSAFTARARAVADAWRSTAVGGAWRTGLVPLQELTIAPAGGFPADSSKIAFQSGWYALRTELPASRPPDGTVRFPSGTMNVSLISARDAYAALDQGDPLCTVDPAKSPAPTGTAPDTPTSSPVSPDCTTLTVTAVRLGTTTLRTSRGEATVPAWLFTVAGLGAPVARVAIVPSAMTPLPSPSVPPGPQPPGLVSAQQLTGVRGATVDFTLGVGACDKDIRPLFYETADAVVLGGTVHSDSGPCILILKLAPVTVTLAAPLGARVVLDAAGGAPLTLTNR
ncbi:MAG TPA: hypothetical protein VFE14_04815 [Micromonosporaceae bacterium]|jgi:hypothetical protein|nr:hypothetical protein [Micromonosporaceae bacterium]